MSRVAAQNPTPSPLDSPANPEYSCAMGTPQGDGANPPRKAVPAKFRGLLKRELPLWVEDGLVSPEQAEGLSERYRLADLGRESSRLLAALIFGIGGLLLGGGVLAFVAAHWEAIPVPLKVALLFGALLGLHGAGWFLWQAKDLERLGRSLIFTGCLVFGANIGLMAQIFHIRSDWYHGFLAWAVGSLAMAWAVRSPLVGLLALGTSFTWFLGYFDHHERLAQIYPPAVLLALLPLAVLAGSRALFALTAWCSLIAVALTTAEATESAQPVLLALVAGGFALWGAGLEPRPATLWERLAGTSRISGMVVLSVAAYIWSFLDLWDEPPSYRADELARAFPFWGLTALAAALLGGYLFLRSLDALRASGRPGFLTWGPLGGVLLLALPGALLLGGSDKVGFLGAVMANLSCLLLGGVAVGSGLAQERRSHFWLGTFFLVLLVLSRFMEYETGLLTKSAAFIACGVAVIFAGIQYEGHLRRSGGIRG